MNLPNKLTVFRIVLVPLVVTFYFLPYAFAPFVAFALFIVAASTDFLDGYVARKYNLVTDFGKLLDPVADKVLVTATLFCCVATNVFGKNPAWWFTLQSPSGYGMLIFTAASATLVLARELLISGVRMIAASKGKVVQANIFGKIKTFSQDVALPLMILLRATDYIDHTKNIQTLWSAVYWLALVVFAFATVMTVVSGVIYIVQNKKVFEND